MQRWDESYGSREVTQAELFEIARDVLDLGTGTTRAQQTHLGNLLTQQRDRWYEQHRIERRGITQGRRRWALEKRNDGG